MAEDQGILWIDNYYDDSLTERVREMFQTIKDAYVKRIEANDWLGEDERR